MDYEREREECTQRILQSPARHRVVVAGPGTGKTFLFKKVCEQCENSVLVLTFINNLADDLSKELGDEAEASTFHAFCKKLIHSLPLTTIRDYSYFPKVSELLEADKAILAPNLGPLQEAFEEYLVGDTRIEFFLNRATYYEAVGHTDAVFRVVRHLQENQHLIPEYGQILVDEYQDFNSLEVEMIRVMGLVSPTLIVGDDDQSLYEFKHATPDFLRLIARDDDHAQFELPFCSRCTEPVVTAVNQIITGASERGLLRDRVNKQFVCYLPDKREDNERYPRLVNVTCTVQRNNAPYITRFVESEIQSIVDSGYRPSHSADTWDFLVAGPKHLLRGLKDVLSERFPNTFETKSTDGELTPLEAYDELARDSDSLVGWRAVLKFLDRKVLEHILHKSMDMKEPLRDLVPAAVQDDILQTVSVLSRFKRGETINAFEETRLIEVLKQDSPSLRLALGLVEEESSSDSGKPRHRIKVSSILACKGLTSNFVFLVGLNNGILPYTPETPTDHEVCKLIVGLTRARKKCYLVSVRNLFGQQMDESSFVRWIAPSLMDEVYVDKKYFQS